MSGLRPVYSMKALLSVEEPRQSAHHRGADLKAGVQEAG
jgi:hypothetical protein